MAYFIELIGKQCVLYQTGTERRLLATIPITALVKRLMRDHAGAGEMMETPVLPSGSKFYYGHEGREVLLYEQIPTMRTVSVGGKRYDLSLPFHVVFVSIEGGVVSSVEPYFRSGPTSSNDDVLSPPVLSPPVKRLVDAAGGGSLTDKVSRIVGAWWGGPVEFSVDGITDERIKTIKTWAEESKKNPLVSLRITWPTHPKPLTVGSVRDRMVGDAGKDKKPAIKCAESVADIIARLSQGKVATK